MTATLLTTVARWLAIASLLAVIAGCIPTREEAGGEGEGVEDTENVENEESEGEENEEEEGEEGED